MHIGSRMPGPWEPRQQDSQAESHRRRQQNEADSDPDRGIVFIVRSLSRPRLPGVRCD